MNQSLERKLAAIMFTDIAGYTAQMSKDQDLAFVILEDTSYLETTYNQIQKQIDNLEPDIKAKFLSYPIPKAIVEEWEKAK